MNEEFDDSMLILDGFDEAIIGIADRIDMQSIVAYNVERIIEILMRSGMTEEEAWEYYEYNILGSYVGDRTPIYITNFDLEP